MCIICVHMLVNAYLLLYVEIDTNMIFFHLYINNNISSLYMPRQYWVWVWVWVWASRSGQPHGGT